jgi:hypothetical protein
MSHAVQPAPQRALLAYRTRVAGENQKGHLKSVLRVVPVAEDILADAQHHRAVPVHKCAEGRLAGLIAPGDKAL